MSVPEETAIIIGAGLAGISASYYLSKNNIRHLILEKSQVVGGIWSSLAWPGIRCDTEIINYSYSFKPFISKQSLVPGEEISNYLQATSIETGMIDKIMFGVKVVRAVFITDKNVWHFYTNKGLFKARFLINANGYFSDTPHIPSIAGTKIFEGKITHLFHLNRRSDFKNKRIVLVGSGASAVSAAPALCSNSLSMTILQRSPSYIYEDNNKIGFFVYLAQKLYGKGLSYPVKLVNYFIQLKNDLVFVMFRKFPWVGKIFFKYHWLHSIDRKSYQENFQPDYNPWEQRIPVAIGLKKAIRTKKINIVTGRIKTFVKSGILLVDGRYIESDLCILATGFDLNFFQFDIFIDYQKVDTRGINFFKGMMMGGIYNYFQPFGPPHTSFTRRIEVVSKLIVKIISYMRRHDLDRVIIDRQYVKQTPRITPGYVMRNLSELPAIYGTLELPSIDNIFYFNFSKNDYKFSGNGIPNNLEYDQITSAQ
ncbi:MAG: NAD(P)/FAD-dependent oxidoreductase [Nitrosomonadaceae bacterium]